MDLLLMVIHLVNIGDKKKGEDYGVFLPTLFLPT